MTAKCFVGSFLLRIEHERPIIRNSIWNAYLYYYSSFQSIADDSYGTSFISLLRRNDNHIPARRVDRMRDYSDWRAFGDALHRFPNSYQSSFISETWVPSFAGVRAWCRQSHRLDQGVANASSSQCKKCKASPHDETELATISTILAGKSIAIDLDLRTRMSF